MLEVTGIKKSYNGDEILRGVGFSMNKGEVVSILGPSGSGKTTLLRCLDFLTKPDSGHLKIEDDEYDLEKVSRKDILRIRRQFGFVFQGYNLFANKTALENVTEGLIVVKKMKGTEAIRIANEALDKVGMKEKAGNYPSELSGGQQQRVAIARAIALGPKVIFFDEPTSALDPELTGEVLSVMKKLADEGTTMIVVTHEMEFARNVSDRIIFMENGIVVEEGSPSDIFERPQKERTAQFIRKASPYCEYVI